MLPGFITAPKETVSCNSLVRICRDNGNICLVLRRLVYARNLFPHAGRWSLIHADGQGKRKRKRDDFTGKGDHQGSVVPPHWHIVLEGRRGEEEGECNSICQGVCGIGLTIHRTSQPGTRFPAASAEVIQADLTISPFWGLCLIVASKDAVSRRENAWMCGWD